MNTARKRSHQRDCIISYLISTKEHPTAETVYEHVREELPNISLGTVYRNLNLLADDGKILRFTALSGNVRFDGNPQQHYHFVCRECGRVLDLEVELNHIDKLAGADFDGIIEGHSVIYYGICPDCKKS